MCWDVIVICPLADSYLNGAAIEAGAAAEVAASSKTTKLGNWISANSSEAREASFLFQRASVLVQRYNAVLLRDTAGR